ncbi:peptidoglycan DD-metalloendopeptidase family protein [Microbispora hainanensis]|uniref:murein hydrolase activator EnvC family protein n=1 Tax=Microbispora hainanensis TaxID=568844 RepID=UPI0033F752BA
MRLVAYVLVLVLLTAAPARLSGAARPVAARGPLEPYTAVSQPMGTAAAEPMGPTGPPGEAVRSSEGVRPVGTVAPGPMGSTGPPGEASGWRWPLSGPARPTRRFDPPPQRWLAGHRGVDLAARPGDEVVAAGPGTVGLAERVAGRGVVTISHSDGLRTTYLPVRALVRPGEVVAAGQVIGVVEEDAAAHCTTPCLHWGLLRGRLYLDPLLLFGRGQVRLLPRWPAG